MSDFGPIPRLEPDPDGLDFDGLQALGMELLQALSGARWTDYNPHDPGVTILDQLCYALTDLAYRTELPHEDYLAGTNGAIDLARHVLHQPQDVFPSEPVTAQDWRRVLYDRIGQVEDAWVRDHEPVPGAPSGLLEIDFRLGGSVSGKTQRNAVRRQIRSVFAARRGLCQDILQVRALKHKDFYLAGHIEIHSLRDPAAIYADIHFRSAACIASGLQIESYEQAAAAGVPPERLFSGPLTQHGRVSDGSQRDRRAPVSLARLVGVIRGIDGVQEVHKLELRGADGAKIDLSRPPPRGWAARLCFPNAEHGRLLRLHTMGKTDSADEDVQAGAGHEAHGLLQDARIALQKLEFESRALRARPAAFERLAPAPTGSGRPLGSYYSIQHQFPAIYGINAHGVPPRAAPAVRAGARQLKAYLYVFEQVMANYLQGLAGVGSLFSLDGIGQSTFAQVIDDTMLPDIEVLYTDDLARIRVRLDGIRARHDRFEDRRERVLDVLLAMYGERYTQQALRKFAVYTHGPRALAEWLLENKLVWLRQIVTLSRERAAAFRYDEPAWGTDNVSGAQRKIAVLLGLHETPHCRSLCAPLREHGLRIVPDASAREYAAEAAGLLDRLGGHGRMPVLRVGETVFREAFLRSRVSVQEGRAIFRAAAAAPDDTWELGRIEAQAGAPGNSRLDAFRAALRSMNIRCEGMHLVEHVLLRPRRDRRAFAPWVPDDYYPFQVSIVFPGWTARFADPEFRKFAEETVSLNLPAHVLPHFYWLGYVAMDDFEQRLQRWYAALRHASLAMQQDGSADPAPSLAALDQASLSLIMILRREARDSTRRWI